MTIYLGDKPLAGLLKPLAGRNVGEIVTSSLPLTDAGLHLLDGSLILGGGIYQGFVDYIAELYGDGTNIPSYFCTEAQWQQSVATYGVCGKFVCDSTNNTVRLPKVTGKLDGTTDLTALSELIEQFVRLPNIQGRITSDGWRLGDPAMTGPFYRENTGGDRPSYGSSGGSEWYFDASRCSSVYSGDGTDTKIHEQAINVLYYIVVATSTKTAIQVDIDEIATDLNGKADVDLTNVNNSGTSRSASWSMPSNTYVDLTLGASGSTYTAPANGYYNLSKNGNSGQYIYFRLVESGITQLSRNTGAGAEATLIVPIKKNDSLQISYTASGTVNRFRFIYAEGSESEAS